MHISTLSFHAQSTVHIKMYVNSYIDDDDNFVEEKDAEERDYKGKDDDGD
jgi:hypothetical protein